jgi:hypothetical protein
MPDEHSFTLQQIDQARGDLYAEGTTVPPLALSWRERRESSTTTPSAWQAPGSGCGYRRAGAGTNMSGKVMGISYET